MASKAKSRQQKLLSKARRMQKNVEDRRRGKRRKPAKKKTKKKKPMFTHAVVGENQRGQEIIHAGTVYSCRPPSEKP